MKKRNLMLVAAGAVALLVAGGLSASNMGFKLNYPLEGPGTNGSNSGLQSLSLPYNQQTNLVNASDLYQDINDTAGSTVVSSIQRFLKNTDELVAYAGGPLDLPNDFALVPGQGYQVQVTTDVNYIVVGSHDPVLQLNFDGPGSNGSNSGLNFYSYPYHSVASTASEVFAEVNGQSQGGNVVVSVQRFLKTTDELVSYAGGPLDLPNDFALVPGQAYRVQVSSNVSYLPDHY